MARASPLGYDRERMHPIILRFGPLTIYSYGLMMAIAFLVAVVVGWVWQLFYGGPRKMRKSPAKEAEPSA